MIRRRASAAVILAIALAAIMPVAWGTQASADELPDPTASATPSVAPSDPAPTPEATPAPPAPTPAPVPPPPPPAPPKPRPVPVIVIPAPQSLGFFGGGRAGDLIEISVPRQTLTAWRNGRIVMQFLVSTGRPGYYTVRGHYRVISKSVNAFSHKWGVIMPWALNWHGNYFIHQVTHYPGSRRLIGVSQLGRPASHGCIREPPGAAERLYRWAHVGTPVWVH